jgi:hypothetical protein
MGINKYPNMFKIDGIQLKWNRASLCNIKLTLKRAVPKRQMGQTLKKI